MARYYFHLFNDLVVNDKEGVDLPDLASAHELAIKNIRELVCEAVQQGKINLNHRIDITDEQGGVLLQVPYREAITVEA